MFISAPRKAALFISAALVAVILTAGSTVAATREPALAVAGVACDGAAIADRGTVIGCVSATGDFGTRVAPRSGPNRERHGIARFVDGIRYSFGERRVADVVCAHTVAMDASGHSVACVGRDGELALAGRIITRAPLSSENCEAKRFVTPDGSPIACVDRNGDMRVLGDVYTESR